jgi:hypothetical protein
MSFNSMWVRVEGRSVLGTDADGYVQKSGGAGARSHRRMSSPTGHIYMLYSDERVLFRRLGTVEETMDP